MKHIFTTVAFAIFTVAVFAQSPEMFNYQGVARDNGGNVLANQAIGLRISIQESGFNDVYVETHSVTTNSFGLFNVKIGDGTLVSGSFASVQWDNGAHYTKVEMDPAGGTSYQTLGTSQLLSVPYALYAEVSGSGGPTGATGPSGADGSDGAIGPTGADGATGPLVAGNNHETLRHSGTDWEASSKLVNTGSKVGVGDFSGFGPNVELVGELTVKESNTATDGQNGVFLDVINSANNTTGALAGIRFGNYDANTSSPHIPGGIFWSSTGQTFGRGDMLFVTGTAGGVANTNTETRMAILNDGNIGIGTLSPTEKLDVNGNLAFDGNGRSILSPDGALNIESSTGMDIILDNDDNSTNSSLKIKRNGESETILEVKESGDVEVEGEYTYASSKTHYASYSWNDFASTYPESYQFGQSGSINSVYGEFVSGGTSLGYASTGLNLPDGARITELRAWIWDDSASPVRVYIRMQTLGTDAASQVAVIESSSATAMASVQELSAVSSITIDNSTKSYFLRFQGVQNTSDTRLYGVRITYTVDQAN